MQGSLEEKLNQLPPQFQEEVEDFVSFLLEKKVHHKRKKLRLSWAGGLQEFENQMTSLDLQKQSLAWWGD